MLIRKNIIDRGVMAFKDKPGEMINSNIFGPYLVLNFQVKLLKKQYSLDEARLGILLFKEMLDC